MGKGWGGSGVGEGNGVPGGSVGGKVACTRLVGSTETGSMAKVAVGEAVGTSQAASKRASTAASAMLPRRFFLPACLPCPMDRPSPVPARRLARAALLRRRAADPHESATQQMNVQMENGLAPIGAGVDHQAVPALGDTLVLG